MNRRDWLVLMLAYKGHDGPAMDPVRVQKGMFLFSEEAGLGPESSYDFEPYNYGPYSSQVRSDLSFLTLKGLAEAIPVQGYSWKRYKLTEEGEARAEAFLHSSDSDKDAAKMLFDIKQKVTSLSFSDLLRDVYDRYPAYAEESIFNG